MRESSVGLFAENDLCAGAFCEFVMAADEVGVQVSFDDVLDL